MALQVFTASLLKEGLVAYLCMEGESCFWSTDLNKATVADEASLESLQAAAERSEKENIIIAPYAIDVIVTETGISAASKREQIRADGPTFRLPQSVRAIEITEGQHAA
ncbi:DUF2849 domain-containing protein [Sneathiella sp.]|jgi:hypothetical protein|uniref:DUF2849 domain-containing protein n=1 Tax=Sneathiella sp. TaxID=1964365 RepID=UPI0039E37307